MVEVKKKSKFFIPVFFKTDLLELTALNFTIAFNNLDHIA